MVAVGCVLTTRALLLGSERGIEQDLSRLGLRTVQVMDGAGFVDTGSSGKRLGPEDTPVARKALEEAGVAATVTEAHVGFGVLSSASKANGGIPVPVVAAEPDYFRSFGARVQSGRLLEDGDAGREPVPCVLDAFTAKGLGVPVKVGDRLQLLGMVGGSEVEIVGILSDPLRMRPKGHTQDVTSGARRVAAQVLAFRNVYVPPDARAGAGTTLILAVVDERKEASRAHDALVESLHARERGLLVWARGTWVRNMLQTITSLTQLVNVVWIIVLLVALVMIATVTLVAVRERTGEMATRRAEGATRAQVIGQLLLEGGLLALLGGLAGIPLGIVAADRLSEVLTWDPWWDAGEVMMSVSLGVLTGLLAAALPAWRASRLDVVEGLRHAA
jgi:putative ABC transport system permease protein